MQPQNILQDSKQTAGEDEPQEPRGFDKREEEIVIEEDAGKKRQDEQTIATPAEETEADQSYVMRSGRISRPLIRLNSYQAQQHLETTYAPVEEYIQETAQVIANNICHWNNVCQHLDDQMFMMFIQTYSLNKGIKKFGQKGMDAATKHLTRSYTKCRSG